VAQQKQKKQRKRLTFKRAPEVEVLPAEDSNDEQADPDLITDIETADSTEESSAPSLPAVSPRDPLYQYLKEASQHPLLDPDEEFSLAMKLKESGDLNAARTLVQANLRLVVKIAFEYKSMYASVMDLIQEGNVGLMKAVSKFDPEKGAKLSYYASWWIRSYILKYLLDNFRLVKIGTTQAQKKLFYHLVREQERLEAQGVSPKPKLLAQKLDVKENEVVEMQQRLSSRGSEVSLDAPVNQDSSGRASFVSFLPDESQGAEALVIHDELLSKLREHLPNFEKELSEKERKVLEERLLADPPRTLQDIANDYSLTRERVRQIEKNLILKLRKYLDPWMDTE